MIPLRDEIPSRRPPYVVWALIVANALVFLLELSLPPEELEAFFKLFGIVPARFTHPEWAQVLGFPADNWWPFLTSLFIHGGWFHIIGNMWFLWIFGPAVEARLGGARYLLVYLFAGVGAALTQAVFLPASTVPMVGASGAISGVAGAYFLLFPTAWILALIWPFPPLFAWFPAAFFLGYWVLIQVLYGVLGVPGVAWWAHVGGFAVGYGLTQVLKPKRHYHDDPFWYREYGF